MHRYLQLFSSSFLEAMAPGKQTVPPPAPVGRIPDQYRDPPRPPSSSPPAKRQRGGEESGALAGHSEEASGQQASGQMQASQGSQSSGQGQASQGSQASGQPQNTQASQASGSWVWRCNAFCETCQAWGIRTCCERTKPIHRHHKCKYCSDVWWYFG
jgi:hypothetical protein